MADQGNSSRRRFVKICAATIAAISSSSCMRTFNTATLKHYPRVRLVDKRGQPVNVANLDAGQSYIFHYPYVSTPCFLLNLDRPLIGGTQLRTKDGDDYNWQGGVGPKRSVVAFSAICAHRMNYPAGQFSFINYRDNQAKFFNKNSQIVERSQVIYCCSEKSVYDPADGARVLGGPAPQPLAAIELEYDHDNDTLDAVGAYGGQLFDQFVEQFALKLSLELNRSDVDSIITNNTKVLPLEEYTRNQILC